jgi:hypothetical protein
MKTISSTGPLTYRLFHDEDLPALLRLWEEDSGWGAITREQWHEWYVETPYEPALIAVAEDGDGRIVGQLAFTPTRVAVDGREVKALRLSAPITRKHVAAIAVAGHGPPHPAIGLYQAGVRAAIGQGFAMVFAFTQRAWLPFLRSGSRFGLPPIADAEFGCVSFPLDGTAELDAPAGRLDVEPVREFSDEFAALWVDARQGLPVRCGLVRSPAWLRYKNGGHLTLAARGAEGKLVGYAAVRRRDGLLADLLARDPSGLTDVLAASLRWLAAHPQERPGVDRLKAMRMTWLEPLMGRARFEDYVFPFFSLSIHPSLPLEAIAPGQWFLMPLD